MSTTLVKAWQREREIERKLAELAEHGLIANEPFNFKAFEEFTADGQPEGYPEEHEYALLISFLGGDDFLDDDPSTPACRCDALYSFETWCIFEASVYEDLVIAIAQLAGDDLELTSVTAELEIDLPVAGNQPGAPIVVPFSDSPHARAAHDAMRDAISMAIYAGAATAHISIHANGKLAELIFQQESCWFDWNLMKCLAALARLRTDNRRFFLAHYGDMATVGYLSLAQIKAIRELGIRVTQRNSRLPLPVYTVSDIEPG